jgi:hypothetical protein
LRRKRCVESVLLFSGGRAANNTKNYLAARISFLRSSLLPAKFQLPLCLKDETN